MYEYKGKLDRVVDGDTIDVIIDLGFKMTTEQRIRLRGVNTPETYSVKKDSPEYLKGKAATDYVIQRMKENNNKFIIQTDKYTGKYGRYLGTIIFGEDPSAETLNQELIRLGHAVEYMV